MQHAHRSSAISYVVRILALIVYLLITLPLVWACIPLRFLHPLFRKLGILKYYLPMDLVQMYWTRGMILLAGVRVRRQGLDRIFAYRGKAIVYMFSHASNLDGFIISSYCPGAPKFVFKRELLWTNPPIAWFGWAAGHIPIDRTQRESAVASLDDAKHRIFKYQRSVAISPEGTRSLTGEIQEFKKGPFHLAEGVAKLGVPIIPVLIYGAFDLWPPKAIFASSGDVTLRIAEPIHVTPTMKRDELSALVHASMVKNLADMKLHKTHATPYDTYAAALVFLTAVTALGTAIAWRLM